MAKEKKLTKTERKEARLRKGKQWLLTDTGSPKKMNKRYRERFHVDAVTLSHAGVRLIIVQTASARFATKKRSWSRLLEDTLFQKVAFMFQRVQIISKCSQVRYL